ncbi:MAG: hypothetical protein K6L80_08565 [Agarilytica sp.]
MTKIKMMIICVCILAFAIAPRNVSAEIENHEPTFHSHLSTHKSISQPSVDNALTNHGFDQVGHGILVILIAGFLALRKR